jgi:hypothetical protein
MTQTDQILINIARSLAVALIEAGYSRNPDDKREVARLQTELCTAVRQEAQTPEGEQTTAFDQKIKS